MSNAEVKKAYALAYKRKLLNPEATRAYEIALKRGLITLEDNVEPEQPTKEVIPEIQGVERPSIDPAPKNIDELMKTSFVMPGYGKGDGGRLTNAARMIAGASSPAIRDAGRQDIKGEVKTLADILSYVATPAGLVSKIPAAMKVGRSLAQTVPQAAAGGLSTYLGEREKGQFVSDALKTAAQQVGIETVVGS